MLQIAPDADIETEEKTDDGVYCAGCGHLVTRTRWALDLGGHERVFINPAGRLFRVRLFRDAPGAADMGTPTVEATWFPGYAWNFALCHGCSRHLGWRFTGDDAPMLFFGLIKGMLTQTPQPG